MDTQTQETFNTIIKDCCKGLRDIASNSQNLKEDQRQELEAYLNHMDMNYFNLEPKTREQENIKAMFQNLETSTALGRLTTILQETYLKLSR